VGLVIATREVRIVVIAVLVVVLAVVGVVVAKRYSHRTTYSVSCGSFQPGAANPYAGFYTVTSHSPNVSCAPGK
jgi:hypothetical protein